MGLTWPRPFLLRPLQNHHQHLVPQVAIYLESACAPLFLSPFHWFVHSLIPHPPLPHTHAVPGEKCRHNSRSHARSPGLFVPTYLEALFLTIFAVVYLSKAHSSSVRTSVSFVVSPQILKIRRLILFYFFPLHFPISCTIAAKQQMGATLTSLAVGFWVVRD